MPKNKRVKIFLVFGIIGVLFIFVFLPTLGHAWRKMHPVNFPSVVPVSQWKHYSSEDGKYHVLLPGIPKSTNETINSYDVDIVLHTTYVWADRQTQYAVNFSDYPKVIERLSFQQQFDASQKGVADKFGNIVSQHDFKLGTYPARDFAFVAGGKANFSGKIRMVMVDRRLYQLMVIFLTKNPHEDDFKTFFDSFSISGKKERSTSLD
jgi:hypothetical protein